MIHFYELLFVELKSKEKRDNNDEQKKKWKMNVCMINLFIRFLCELLPIADSVGTASVISLGPKTRSDTRRKAMKISQHLEHE
jgi:hypothetical protein